MEQECGDGLSATQTWACKAGHARGPSGGITLKQDVNARMHDAVLQNINQMSMIEGAALTGFLLHVIRCQRRVKLFEGRTQAIANGLEFKRQQAELHVALRNKENKVRATRANGYSGRHAVQQTHLKLSRTRSTGRLTVLPNARDDCGDKRLILELAIA